ncbi:MAG: hypothetical protein R3E57_03670 [Porticoccaceae bacterium]
MGIQRHCDRHQLEPDAGQSVVYEEGKSYGITVKAEATDADGDKATDSVSFRPDPER